MGGGGGSAAVTRGGLRIREADPSYTSIISSHLVLGKR